MRRAVEVLYSKYVVRLAIIMFTKDWGITKDVVKHVITRYHWDGGQLKGSGF